MVVVQFEYSINNNEHETISRKDAKAQRKACKLIYSSRPLRAFFASLRLCAKLFFPLMKLNHY
jgi:hypothetical protein